MPNVLSRLNIHYIFAVNSHPFHFSGEQREELYQFVQSFLHDQNQQVLAMAILPDHLHLLVDMHPDTALSDLARQIKTRTAQFINRKKWAAEKFNWQKGFGAFSFGQSQVDPIIRFLQNQDHFHSRKTFRQEYQEILNRFTMSDAEKYLFEEI